MTVTARRPPLLTRSTTETRPGAFASPAPARQDPDIMTEPSRHLFDFSNRVGVIGLGIMGQALAANLEKDGHLAASWNRSPRPQAPRFTDSFARLATDSDIILIVVTDDQAVSEILAALLPELESRHTLIQCSTVTPDANRRFAEQSKAAGIAFVEALIAGSKPAAENRQIMFYTGGDTDIIEYIDPLLRTLAANTVQVGEVGAASAAKLATNLYLAIQIAGIAECYAYARQSGLDDEAIFTVLRNNITWNKMAEFKEPKLRQQDFSPQFSVSNMLKDIRLALDTCRDTSLMVMLQAAERQYQAAVYAGFGDEDMIAIYRLISEAANPA